MPVSHAHREVGIGCLAPIVHFAKAAHIGAAKFCINLAVTRHKLGSRLYRIFQVRQELLYERVVHQSLRVFLVEHGSEFFLRQEQGVVVKVVHVSVHVRHPVKHGGLCRELLIFKEERDKEFHLVAVVPKPRAVYFFRSRKQFFLYCADFVLLPLFNRAFKILHQRDRHIEFLLAEGDDKQHTVVEAVLGCGAHRIDAFNDIGVFGLAALGRKGAEAGFLRLFLCNQSLALHGLVHAVEILNGVGPREIRVLVSEAQFVALVHEFLVEVEQGIAGRHDRSVERACAQCHLRGSEIAVRASGEAHNHGVVALLRPGEGDGQIFGRGKGAVLRTIICGLPVLVGIDAEHGEVGVVARPHPVVGIAAKLPDVLRGRCHEAHVGVFLHPYHVEAVGIEEGNDFGAYALASFKLLDIFPLLCHGFEETLALHLGCANALLLGEGEHLVGHVLNLQHEGKGKVGRGEFLGAAVCEEAVLGVVVLLGAHVVHVTEPAVVVGEYQSLGRHHLARAASAEHADAVAQRGRRFAVKGFGRQLQPGFFK